LDWSHHREVAGREDHLSLLLEPLIAAKAKANQVARKGEQAGPSCQKSDKLIDPIDTKKEIAKAADVSHDTVAKVKIINKAAEGPADKTFKVETSQPFDHPPRC
jgi:hypothetical protein